MNLIRVEGPQFDTVQQALETALLADLAETNLQGLNCQRMLALNSPTGELKGGIAGSTSYGWLLVKLLWVAPEIRNLGWGGRLLEQLESDARDLGCHDAWLDTSNPAAQAFYARHGYQCFGELANSGHRPLPGHRRWFMKKQLSP